MCLCGKKEKLPCDFTRPPTRPYVCSGTKEWPLRIRPAATLWFSGNNSYTGCKFTHLISKACYISCGYISDGACYTVLGEDLMLLLCMNNRGSCSHGSSAELCIKAIWPSHPKTEHFKAEQGFPSESTECMSCLLTERNEVQMFRRNNTTMSDPLVHIHNHMQTFDSISFIMWITYIFPPLAHF